ncbi:MAG: hypothetical protein BGO70_17145 [Bacteroidetes bacterium 43-93]|nr:hypothetical protein [Bacteroidota bacterium]OJX01477.1 MAG: hypothetical protein BGO70_17145 [Bacteroidetes bacterium 43-93]
MKVKKIWTDADFDEMCWHDSIINSILLPSSDKNLNLNIDYIYDWVDDEASRTYHIWKGPCSLSFSEVNDLAFSQTNQDIQGTYISEISRRKTDDDHWYFEIVTGLGIISFVALGYTQIAKEQPVYLIEGGK